MGLCYPKQLSLMRHLVIFIYDAQIAQNDKYVSEPRITQSENRICWGDFKAVQLTFPKAPVVIIILVRLKSMKIDS